MSLVLNRTLDGNFISRYLRQTAADILPRRLKRLIFLSSILGVVIQNKNPDPDLLGPLNRSLRMAYTVPGLMLPIYMHDRVWKSVMREAIVLKERTQPITHLAIHEMDDGDLWRIGVFFTRRVSACLTYGSAELMTSDVHDLLVLLGQFPCDRGVCLRCTHCVNLVPPKEHIDLYDALRHDHRKHSA